MKKIVLAAVYYSGVFGIFRIILSKMGYVPILVYHSVRDSLESNTGKSAFYLRGLAVSSRQFKEQVAYLGKRYEVISLAEYLERRKKNAGVSSCAVITFDDGFRDSAIPTLMGRGFPATVFITPGFLHRIYWRHLVNLLFDHAQAKDVKLKTLSGETMRLSFDNDDEKSGSIAEVVSVFAHLPEDKRDAMMDRLSEALGVKKTFRPQDVYLTAEEIKGLSGSGVDFGAHSSTHMNLLYLDDEELHKEIRGSREALEALTGKRDLAFAVPFGSYDERTVSAIREEGLICSVTSRDGLNKDDDIYRLRRVGITACALPAFAYRVSGAEMIIQDVKNACRSRAVSLIKRLDRLTGHVFGDAVRNATDINKAKSWDSHYSKFDLFERDFPYKFLADFLPENTAFSLLDIGCGMGEGCDLLRRRFPSASIEGADFSPLAIGKARSRKNGVNYFVMDLKREDPPHKYDFISLVHILEHFNDPFIILDRCLKYVNTAVLISTPYMEHIDDPRLYARGEHRYLFNERTFSGYRCTMLTITDIFPITGTRHILYRIEP